MMKPTERESLKIQEREKRGGAHRPTGCQRGKSQSVGGKISF